MVFYGSFARQPQFSKNESAESFEPTWPEPLRGIFNAPTIWLNLWLEIQDPASLSAGSTIQLKELQ